MKTAIPMAMPSLGSLSMEPDRVRQLIRAAKAGSDEAFAELVALHDRRVLGLAQRILLNREAAQDAAQDVFLRLHRKLAAIKEEKDLGAWLYRTTTNVCFDLLRKAKAELPLDLTAQFEAVGQDPEEMAAAVERQRLLMAGLQKLSTHERQAIVLRELKGYSTAEVAAILGSSETTVRSQISTGRVKLRRHLLREGRKER